MVIKEMGQRLSCVQQQHEEQGVLFPALASGELEVVEAMVEEDPTVLEHTTGCDRLSPLHVAAANGRIEVVLASVLHYSLTTFYFCSFMRHKCYLLVCWFFVSKRDRTSDFFLISFLLS